MTDKAFIHLIAATRPNFMKVTPGLHEVTTYLDTPCLTQRPNTGRPITNSEGSIQLVKPVGLLENVQTVMQGIWFNRQRSELWEGKAAGHCVDSLVRPLELMVAA